MSNQIQPSVQNAYARTQQYSSTPTMMAQKSMQASNLSTSFAMPGSISELPQQGQSMMPGGSLQQILQGLLSAVAMLLQQVSQLLGRLGAGQEGNSTAGGTGQASPSTPSVSTPSVTETPANNPTFVASTSNTQGMGDADSIAPSTQQPNVTSDTTTGSSSLDNPSTTSNQDVEANKGPLDTIFGGIQSVFQGFSQIFGDKGKDVKGEPAVPLLDQVKEMLNKGLEAFDSVKGIVGKIVEVVGIATTIFGGSFKLAGGALKLASKFGGRFLKHGRKIFGRAFSAAKNIGGKAMKFFKSFF